MPKFYIYVHKTKDDGVPFYVGKGTRRRAWSWSGRNSKWTEVAKRHGMSVEIVSHHDNQDEAFEVEKALISQLSQFFNLCNIAKGGAGGTSAGYRHSDEIKARISTAQKGRKKSDDHRRKLSEAISGRQLSEETRAKMSVSHRSSPNGNGLLGKLKTDAHKKLLAVGVMGKPKSTNKSGYPGVYWHKSAKKWCAQITVGGASRYLGLHETAEAASAAYNLELEAIKEEMKSNGY
jgi:hypothetical protein